MIEPANVRFRQDLCLANKLALSTALTHLEHLILVYLFTNIDWRALERHKTIKKPSVS